jgi:hypothetical protein
LAGKIVKRWQREKKKKKEKDKKVKGGRWGVGGGSLTTPGGKTDLSGSGWNR